MLRWSQVSRLWLALCRSVVNPFSFFFFLSSLVDEVAAMMGRNGSPIPLFASATLARTRDFVSNPTSYVSVFSFLTPLDSDPFLFGFLASRPITGLPDRAASRMGDKGRKGRTGKERTVDIILEV
jgi:hypothetical protein